MSKKLVHLFTFVIISLSAFSQTGHNISVNMNITGEQTLYLVYYVGEKQYIAEESTSTTGNFNFHGDEKIEKGIYQLVLKENSTYLEQIIINDDQFFEITGASKNDFVKGSQVIGSTENFYYYQMSEQLFGLAKEYKDIETKYKTANEEEKKSLEKQATEISYFVIAKRNEFIAEHPDFLVSKTLKLNSDYTLPTAEELGISEDEYRKIRLELHRKEYLKLIDVQEDGLLRTREFYQYIHKFINNFYLQDSTELKSGITRLLALTAPNPEMYKLTLIEMVNKFSKEYSFHGLSTYAFLVENYYAKGKAPWASEETINGLVKAAQKIRVVEIGKTAPNITLLNTDGEAVSSYDMDAKYKVLLFWSASDEQSCSKTQEFINITRDLPTSQLQVYAVEREGDKTTHLQKVIQLKLNTADNWTNVLGSVYDGKNYQENYRNFGKFYFILLDANNQIIMRGNNPASFANAL